jgi:hypothetical protein
VEVSAYLWKRTWFLEAESIFTEIDASERKKKLTPVSTGRLFCSWRQTSLFTKVCLSPLNSCFVNGRLGIVTSEERTQLLKQKGATIWLTGLSASGKVIGSECIRTFFTEEIDL